MIGQAEKECVPACLILIYNSYREGRLPIRMEASPFSIQPLYTTHKEKADSMSEWRLPKKREWYGHGHPSLSPTRLGERCFILHHIPNKQKGEVAMTI